MQVKIASLQESNDGKDCMQTEGMHAGGMHYHGCRNSGLACMHESEKKTKHAKMIYFCYLRIISSLNIVLYME